jgi:transmembrane sensor
VPDSWNHEAMDDELLYRAATGRATADEQRVVAKWRAASAANERRYQEIVDVLRLTAAADDRLSFGPAPSTQELLGRTGAFTGGAARRRRHVLRGWRGALLAAAAVVAVAISLPHTQALLSDGGSASTASGSDEFVTETEAATVGLRDGSVVRLAPETRLRVHATRDGREVSLSGRGYFAVAADAAQPFTVHSDAAVVTVIGTRFDLTAVGEDLRLIVVEGSVRLSVRGAHVIVRAGQLAQVIGGNLVPPVDVPDPASLIGWMGNFIAFQDTPLRTVVREIEQRYGVRVELAQPEIGDRTVTALFAGRSYEEITEVICVVANLQCSRDGDVVMMAPAR